MRYRLDGLDCPSCALEIEDELRKTKGLESLIVNFANQSIDLDPEQVAAVQEVISRVEPDVRLAASPEKHDQHVHESEEAGEKNQVYLLVFAGFLLAIGFFFNETLHRTPYSIGEYLIILSSYLMVGGKVIAAAVTNLARGRFFDENFLMTIATFGAIAIHQLPEAAAVMLFYAVGEYFQDKAVDRSRRSIKALMDIRPDYANLRLNGETTKVAPDQVEVGQTIVIKPGEKVPLDGEVLEGTSLINTSALTGESVPRKVEPGEKILAGMVNAQGLLIAKVTKTFAESSVAKILELVENAGARKAPTEQFITRFSRYYTPVVVFSALALAIIPPLVVRGATFADWVYRALILLVISCPCALVVSIPLGYFGGIGGASRRGILVKGANYLEALTHLHTVVFDKTGTLTKGVFKVNEVVPQNGFSREDLIAVAAAAELHSNHPIAQSIRAAHGKEIAEELVSDYQEIPGHGIRAKVQGRTVLAGNDRLLHLEQIQHDVCSVEGTVVYVAVDGTFAGHILISDELKEDAAQTVARLKALGVKLTIMLTGDEEKVAKQVARVVGVDDYSAELLPEDKVRRVEELRNAMPANSGYRLAFVGDGINDAPVITRADVGVAMGGLGSDAAIEAADVVIMDDAPSRLVAAITLARKTSRIVRQNVILALTVKLFFVALGAVGVATIWEAVFADVGVALLAIFNAMRTLRYRETGGD